MVPHYQTALTRAENYERRGDFGRAFRSYRAALSAAHCEPGLNGDATLMQAECLVRLGRVVRLAGRYRWAESLLVRAIREAHARADGNEGLSLAAMNELAVLYKSIGRFDEAARLYHCCLSIVTARQAGDSHDLATLYHNLGGLEHARRCFAAGEPYGRNAVAMRERLVGPDHPWVAGDAAALAALLDGQGKFDEAEALYRRALSIFERTLGPDHYELSVSLNNLAAIAQARGDYDTAGAYYLRAMNIKEKALGLDHPEVATTLNNMAILREKDGDLEAAAELFKRAFQILSAALPNDHPHVRACKRGYRRVTQAVPH